MKKLVLLASVVYCFGCSTRPTGGPVQANFYRLPSSADSESETAPSTLSETMKAMDADLKTLAAQSNDVTRNPQSAALSEHFTWLVLHAKNFTPDSIAALPANEQSAAKADFDKMLQEASQMGVDLATAFRQNNNSVANNILKNLKLAKREGHDKYK